MIIKSMSHKKASGIPRLIAYADRKVDGNEAPLLWNLETDTNDLKGITQEFQLNQGYLKPRKNGVVFYHEILSLNGADCQDKKKTSAILKDCAEQYLKIRAYGTIAYGRVHYSQNPHIHLIFSANEYKSSQKIRLSKKEFANAKKQLEAYQKSKYPQLENSQVDHQPQNSTKQTQSRKEQEHTRRQKKQHGGKRQNTKKEQLAQSIQSTLYQSFSAEEFTLRLKDSGYRLYQRGKTLGVVHIINQRKHRLKTLDVFELYQKRVEQWERTRNRAKETEEIGYQKSQQIWRENGVKEKVMGIVEADPKNVREREIWTLTAKKNEIETQNRGMGRERARF